MEKPDAGLRGLDHCKCILSELLTLADNVARPAKVAHVALPTSRKAHPFDPLGNAISGNAARQDAITRPGFLFRRHS